ncbi:MAG: threonine--tRNA ligase [Chloroflexi bacterium HGW-Chloroflexi-10]|nr:MAG: threonine--tRNA ligase [Chloroflexi bacterium HGW-Chloroflexi-10]
MAKKVDTVYEASQLFRIRHSTAHVMAQAVLEKFPEAKIAIGPAIDEGFYYDFDLPRALTPEDLEEIEKKMKHILKGNHKFEREVISADQAREVFKDQPYKLELIEGLEQGGEDEHGNPLEEKPEISLYHSSSFVDLCRGPHVQSTREINPKAVKLISIAGAYWRGDEKRPMLQRIYGTAFEDPEALNDYLWRMEEAKKRDHRKLGKELDLFSVSQEIGPGLILWHPKGGLIRHFVEDYCKVEHLANGYDVVYSPHIGRANLWETSGHLGFYSENMFAPMEIEGDNYYAKPMNCPFHIMIYKNKMHSYRDFPIRMAEWGTVYRYERSGVLHGLLRVRGFTQDDAHLFCREDQMPEEIDRVLNFCLHILRHFGMNDFHAYLSTRNPEKSVGETKNWEVAQEALRAALDRADLNYDIDEGGAAFYGPKIDLKMIDALGREWQLSTIQFDFNMPERFGMSYIGEDGQQHRPFMIHRALLGSLERFMGVLIEHYGGAFPVWMMPIQAQIIPIADRHVDYAHKVAAELKAAGVRVEVDDSNDRMNAKIRNAQLQKTPYMLVIGDKEAEAGEVALRLRNGENPGSMPLADFLARVKEDVANLA